MSTISKSLQEIKACADGAFREKKFQEAINFYSECIALDSTMPALYSNRSACYIQLGSFEEALKDAESAISLGFNKGHFRKAAALYSLQRVELCLSSLYDCNQLLPSPTEYVPLCEKALVLACEQKIPLIHIRSIEMIIYFLSSLSESSPSTLSTKEYCVSSLCSFLESSPSSPQLLSELKTIRSHVLLPSALTLAASLAPFSESLHITLLSTLLLLASRNPDSEEIQISCWGVASTIFAQSTPQSTAVIDVFISKNGFPLALQAVSRFSSSHLYPGVGHGIFACLYFVTGPYLQDSFGLDSESASIARVFSSPDSEAQFSANALPLLPQFVEPLEACIQALLERSHPESEENKSNTAVVLIKALHALMKDDRTGAINAFFSKPKNVPAVISLLLMCESNILDDNFECDLTEIFQIANFASRRLPAPLVDSAQLHGLLISLLHLLMGQFAAMGSVLSRTPSAGTKLFIPLHMIATLLDKNHDLQMAVMTQLWGMPILSTITQFMDLPLPSGNFNFLLEKFSNCTKIYELLGSQFRDVQDAFFGGNGFAEMDKLLTVVSNRIPDTTGSRFYAMLEPMVSAFPETSAEVARKVLTLGKNAASKKSMTHRLVTHISPMAKHMHPLLKQLESIHNPIHKAEAQRHVVFNLRYTFNAITPLVGLLASLAHYCPSIVFPTLLDNRHISHVLSNTFNPLLDAVKLLDEEHTDDEDDTWRQLPYQLLNLLINVTLPITDPGPDMSRLMDKNGRAEVMCTSLLALRSFPALLFDFELYRKDPVFLGQMMKYCSLALSLQETDDGPVRRSPFTFSSSASSAACPSAKWMLETALMAKGAMPPADIFRQSFLGLTVGIVQGLQRIEDIKLHQRVLIDGCDALLSILSPKDASQNVVIGHERIFSFRSVQDCKVFRKHLIPFIHSMLTERKAEMTTELANKVCAILAVVCHNKGDYPEAFDSQPKTLEALKEFLGSFEESSCPESVRIPASVAIRYLEPSA